MQKPVYYHKFIHLQAYSHPIQTYSVIVAYSETSVTFIFRILAYLKHEIYLEQGIFWYTRNAVKRLHIENPARFRTLSNSEF